MKKFIQGYTLRYTIYYKKYNDITTKWAFQGGETNTELKRVKAFQKHWPKAWTIRKSLKRHSIWNKMP